ncbi:MAG: ABC transporter ATP-binding protein [Bryobacterales bacterium]|nr:ABC transporter ATP-binding protein [Bryobacterales bacterium]
METTGFSVRASGLSKSYPAFSSPTERLRQLLFRSRRPDAKTFWALRDATFDIQPGETFCIVGQNGSGKSTLLQMIAGILPPTGGNVEVNGKLAALLELGAGFNPEFTGRENVLLNGSLLGIRRSELLSRLPSIEAFAEIGAFLDQPVKTYSSGMLVRLAFAVAVHVDPQILIVDEALAVGDIYFRQRCMRKVHELKRHGTTIIYVTHSAADVRAIGDRCLWLDAGQIRECGDPEPVVSHYLAEMLVRDSRYVHAHPPALTALGPSANVEAPELVDGIPNVDHRWGNQGAEIIGVALTNSTGKPLATLNPHAEAVLRVSIRTNKAIIQPIVGYVLRNHLGIDLAVSNTLREGIRMTPLADGTTVTVDFHLTMPELYPAAFAFSAAIADGTLEKYEMCDFVENAVSVHMAGTDKPIYGYLHLPCRIGINQRLSNPTSQEALHG